MKRKKLLLTVCLAVMATGNVMADDAAATWTATTVEGVVTDQYFPLLSTNVNFNLNVFPGNTGTSNAFDDATKTITFKFCDATNKDYVGGMVGWEVYDKNTNGWWNQEMNVNFTTYKYLVVQLNNTPGYYQELHYVGTTTADNGKTYSDAQYAMDLGSANSNHCSVSTTEFVTFNDVTKYSMTNVMRVSLRDGATNVADPSGSSADNCGQLKLSNVFLTNKLPDWEDNPVTKTPTANFGTICLPYTATAVGAYIYQISSKSNDGSTIYLTPYNGLLKAGVPYIYKALSPKTTVSFYQIESGTRADASTSGNNGLVGKYTGSAEQGTNFYVLYNDKLYKVDSDVSITNGAYIDLSNVKETAAAKGTSLDVSEGTTGISAVSTENTNNSNNAIYNLSGIRVSNDQQKGIYIKNGIKYIKNK